MAIGKEVIINYSALLALEENLDENIRQEHDVEKLILYFKQISSGMDRRRYHIAIYQINSLKKRMTFHPDNLSLTHYYIQEIKNVILYEKKNIEGIVK